MRTTVPFHVKVTKHFLDRSREFMRPADLLRLWDVLEDGSLHWTVARRAGYYKVAVKIGCVFIVAAMDDRDPKRGTIVLLTCLTESRSNCVRRRQDTIFAELASEKPFAPHPPKEQTKEKP